jgi:hypothetical protein
MSVFKLTNFIKAIFNKNPLGCFPPVGNWRQPKQNHCTSNAENAETAEETQSYFC